MERRPAFASAKPSAASSPPGRRARSGGERVIGRDGERAFHGAHGAHERGGGESRGSRDEGREQGDGELFITTNTKGKGVRGQVAHCRSRIVGASGQGTLRAGQFGGVFRQTYSPAVSCVPIPGTLPGMGNQPTTMTIDVSISMETERWRMSTDKTMRVLPALRWTMPSRPRKRPAVMRTRAPDSR